MKRSKKIKQNSIENEKRILKQNEEELERAKEDIYAKLIDSTDQSKLLHIQRRNNLDNDLLSLQNMYTEYLDKIQKRKEANEQLTETIAQLRKDELIEASATDNHEIQTLKSEIHSNEKAISQFNKKVEKDRVVTDQDRKEEIRQLELSLKQQQDNLDHKIQQINSIRELTSNVLAYRSQLEYEFLMVLGESIYEVSSRVESDTATFLTSAKITQSSSSSRSLAANKRISVPYVLSQFTTEDRVNVLQRFLDKVQRNGENLMEQTN